MKLEKKVIRLDISKYFFSQRVIDYWNALPQAAIDPKSIKSVQESTKDPSEQYHKGVTQTIGFHPRPDSFAKLKSEIR